MSPVILSFGQGKEECFQKNFNMDRQDEQDKRHEKIEF